MKNYMRKKILQLIKESDSNSDINIDDDYFFTTHRHQYGYLYDDIEMNITSFSIICDSLIATHPRVAFIVSLINFFQTLTVTSKDSPKRYGS